MNRILPKQPRLRLDPELYERLREQVLRRDGWRCQILRQQIESRGSPQGIFAARAGMTPEENLITLCARCHSQVHRCFTE